MKKLLGIDVNTVARAQDRRLLSLCGTWSLKLDPANRGMAEG